MSSHGGDATAGGRRLSLHTQDRTALKFAIAGQAILEVSSLDGVCKCKWQSQNKRRKLEKLHCEVVCLLCEQAKKEAVLVELTSKAKFVVVR